MSINLEYIRRRMEELNGTRRNSNIQLWKPSLGEYKVRLLPWKNAKEGEPFIERWFYYIGNNSGILTPKQFGKPDPIDEFIHKLFMSGKTNPDDKALAKKLLPKMRVFAPMIIRGQEDKGVLVWSFGKIVYQRLFSFFLDEDAGDILDPENGFDLKVTITQQPGKQYPDTAVDCKKQCKLMNDPEQMKALLDAVPNIDDMYRQKTKEEIEAVLNAWLNSDTTPDVVSEGISRGGELPTKDALDDIVADVKASAAKSETVDESEDKPTPKVDKKSLKAKAPKDETSVTTAPKKQLDDAFADLMNDD